jgi:hypothetical protein
MSISTRYGIYGASLAGTVIPVSSDRLSLDAQVTSDITSGNTSPTAVHLVGASPKGTITSPSIAAVFDLVGLFGLRISDTPLYLYGQKFGAGAGPASGSNHLRFAMAKGCVYPMSIRCDHQGDAMIELGILAESSNGTTFPIAVADSQALPTNGTDTARFTLGAVTVGSIALPGIRGFDLQFNLTVEADGADSDLYPTNIAVVELKPVLTLNGVNPAWFGGSAVPGTGLCGTHANTSIYLRKRSPCDPSKFVADATAEHILITACGLCTFDTILEGSGSGRRTNALKVTTKHDGTNQPVVIDTTTALA